MQIELRSENELLKDSVDFILSKFFGSKTEQHSDALVYGKRLYSSRIPKNLTDRIFLECGIAYKDDSGYFRLEDGISDYILEDNCCVAAYIRGAFLGSGYIGIPKDIENGRRSSGYLLEFNFSRRGLAEGFKAVMETAGFLPKLRQKSGNQVYLKNSAQICDILTLIGASKFALIIHSELAGRSIRNHMQRSSNCMSHNFDKTVTASAEVINAINILEKRGLLARMDENMLELASIRRVHPEMSLSELARHLSFKISKSGLKFKLDKFIELAKTK